jgi:hypothetical protein
MSIVLNLTIIIYNMNTEIKDENFSFYHEYCRLFLANTVLLTEMRQLFNERN